MLFRSHKKSNKKKKRRKKKKKKEMTVVGICLNISVLIGVDRIGLQGYIVEKVANTLDSTTVNCRHKPQNSRSVSYWQ